MATINLKKQFLEALNETPAGIASFLTTPIPTLQSFDVPTDVDAAIVAQGILSYNVNEILKTFSGLTPVELLLRIGQHNSVLQAAILLGSELMGGKNEYDFEIVFPQGGITYAPQTFALRITIISGIDAVYSAAGSVFVGETPETVVTLERDGETADFVGDWECTEAALYTLQFDVVFDTGDEAQQYYPVSKTIDMDIQP